MALYTPIRGRGNPQCLYNHTYYGLFPYSPIPSVFVMEGGDPLGCFLHFPMPPMRTKPCGN